MVLGPPRSGKTTAVMIPALMAASGAVVSTSTKLDVMRATIHARRQIGEVWLFDPTGTEQLPDGVRRLGWSPVTAAHTWDEALVMARAMTTATNPGAGTVKETHWAERAIALLLYAANLTSRPVEEVLRWTLRQDLTTALEVLADCDTPIPADVLIGIERTETRERSSIFSATAGVLAAYNSDSARETAARPNFDPARFARSTDTLYITAPEHKQNLTAPLIVGLLEQIRHAVYDQARSDGTEDRMLDGFMTLFQTKLILNGIADTRTLDAISLALGEYDREMVSQALGSSDPQEWFSAPTHSDTVNYQTQRQRTLTPGEIARRPLGRGLLLQGAAWDLIALTPWHQTQPWKTIAQPRTV
jgi:type IV secretion system protein VirD4